VLRYMNLKDKGWRYVDTHAGAGGYSLKAEYANKGASTSAASPCCWSATTCPQPLADLVALVRQFNDGKAHWSSTRARRPSRRR
jgi:23S rRNA (adenine2030-N6)-methyltransferase